MGEEGFQVHTELDPFQEWWYSMKFHLLRFLCRSNFLLLLFEERLGLLEHRYQVDPS